MTFSSVTLSEAKGLKILRFAQNDNVVICKLNSYIAALLFLHNSWFYCWS